MKISGKEKIRLLLVGAAMGAADIVPGVSGGTMAFIFGVYERLLNAIKSFNISALKLLLSGNIKGLLKHLPITFLVCLGSGIVAAIVVLASFVKHSLAYYPTFLFAFFGGLIIGSIFIIGSQVKWKIGTIASFCIGTVIAAWIVSLDPSSITNHSSLTLFLSGVVAICAMVLPGISGSFILLLLGQYDFIIEAVHNRDLVTIATVGAGCAVGILSFVRVVSYLFKKFRSLTIACLTGFMFGSLRLIWDRSVEGISLIPNFGSREQAMVIGLVLFGLVGVIALERKSPSSRSD